MSCVTDFVVDLMASLKALLCNHLFRRFINNKVKYTCVTKYTRDVDILKVALLGGNLRKKFQVSERGWRSKQFYMCKVRLNFSNLTPLKGANKEGPLEKTAI